MSSKRSFLRNVIIGASAMASAKVVSARGMDMSHGMEGMQMKDMKEYDHGHTASVQGQTLDVPDFWRCLRRFPPAGTIAGEGTPMFRRSAESKRSTIRAVFLKGYTYLICALIALPCAADAQTLRDLISEALANSPEVVAAQKRYEAARQRPSQASSLPDPMFGAGYSSNGRPWPGAGLGTEPTSQIGFMYSQEFPFPGKRKLAGDMAVKEAEAEWQQYQQIQLSVVSRLKQAYYRRAYAFAAVDVLDRNLQLLDNLLRITEARYQVGRAAQQDIFKAQTQISILETRRLQVEREKRAREAEISSVVNRPPGSTLDRPENLRPLDLPATLEKISAAAREKSPMLRRDQKMIERAELAVNMARKEYYPDFTLNGGYYYMGRMPDMYMFRVDFKIPIYFFRKQRAGVTEQAQTLVQTRKTYEATNQEVNFRLQDDYLMAQTSEQLARIYKETVIPQASLALESSLSSYETGTVDFLTVFTNYITVVEYEMNYYEELQNLYAALVRLEEMTAMPLIP